MHKSHDRLRAEVRDPIVWGRFVQRPNRFLALVEIEENGETRIEKAHVPDPGRLSELLLPGRRLVMGDVRYRQARKVAAALSASQHTARPYVVSGDVACHVMESHDAAICGAASHEGSQGARKTAFYVLMVDIGGRLVALGSKLAGELAYKALRCGAIAELCGPCDGGEFKVTREVAFGGSRLDFLVEGQSGGRSWRRFVELKSVSYAEGGVAKFPDAPTERGVRHLAELSRAVADGYKAGVLFLIQRDDVEAFAPFRERDPKFARALSEAAKSGVDICANTCTVDERGMTLGRAVPVILD